MIISYYSTDNKINFEAKYKYLPKVQKEAKRHISKATKGLDKKDEFRLSLNEIFEPIKKGNSYKEIAAQNNITITTAYNKVKSKIIQIKEKTNSASTEEMNFIHLFKSKFNLFDKDEARIYKAIHNKPELLKHSPQEIKDNINLTVTALKNYGLTEEKFVNAALKQPPLLYIPSKTIVGNFQTVINAFADENINPKLFLKNCLNNPSVLYTKPETIIKRIKIANFILKDKASNSNFIHDTPQDLLNKALGKKLTNSDEHFYTRFLNRKLFKSIKKDKLIESDLKNKLKQYLRENPELRYTFNVVNDECAEDFIRFAQDFSISVLNKNVFNISII